MSRRAPFWLYLLFVLAALPLFAAWAGAAVWRWMR